MGNEHKLAKLRVVVSTHTQVVLVMGIRIDGRKRAQSYEEGNKKRFSQISAPGYGVEKNG